MSTQLSLTGDGGATTTGSSFDGGGFVKLGMTYLGERGGTTSLV